MKPFTKGVLDPRLKPIVEELRALLREHGLTQAEVERRAGMSPKYLYKIFAGYQDMKVKHICDVLDVLEVPHEEFWARLAPQRRSLLPAEMSMVDLTAHIESVIQRTLEAHRPEGDKDDEDNGGGPGTPSPPGGRRR